MTGKPFFFFDFLLSFFSVYLHCNITFLSLQIFQKRFYDFINYLLLEYAHTLTLLFVFFFTTKTVKLFQEIRPTVGKPCPLYILL